MPVCKLCRQDVPKLVKSHIIPKSMYGFRHLNGDKGPTKLVPISNDLRGMRPKRIPSGLYERILCHKCEEITSKFDSYAYDVLYRRTKIPIKNKIYPVGYIIRGVNVYNMLLFFASLLLRMSFSHSAAFGNVNLGIYEDRYRRSLLDGNIDYLGGMDGFISFYDNNLSATFMNPYKSRIFNIMHYSISIFNYAFDIKVSDNQEYPKYLKVLNIGSMEDNLILIKRDLYNNKNFQIIAQKIKGGISV